jgi:hypothetical protein
MAFFKIDPEKAKTQEGRLNEYGAFVSSQRSKIYKSSENNSHPVGTVEEAARAYGSAPSTPGGGRVLLLLMGPQLNLIHWAETGRQQRWPGAPPPSSAWQGS